MSELRQDRTTGAWVIVAPERGVRPHHLSCRSDGAAGVQPFDPACPFCPGNESQLPGILVEVPSIEPPGWRARVVPNKYPVVQPAPAKVQQGAGPQWALPSYGHHEVVIESPRHDADPASISVYDMEAVAALYRQRFADLLARPGIETVIMFRNHGAEGGASLRHPHSQLVALGMVPPRLQFIIDWARQRFAERGRCVTCEQLEIERAEGSRIIEETRFFVALAPFAASVPFEVWLVPKRHQASFSELDETECADLGRLLRRTLQRLKSAHNDPPYNFVVESFDTAGSAAAYAHWRLRIAPDLVTWGGFELGAGVPINPSSPERDAGVLRTMKTHDGAAP
jgi:UDPglucose--hexose-1-phosphate uridylyltransferase